MATTPVLPEGGNRRVLSYVFLATGCILLLVAFLAGISDNLPGIVSMLVGLLAVVLGITHRFTKPGTRKPAQQLLYWTPRALCIVIALFISMFALDVFGEGRGFWNTALALLMHLIPTFLILLVLAISWRREWIGGILFVVLAVLYAAWTWQKPFAGSAILLISGPLVLTGALFLINWHYRRELRGAS